MANTDDAAHERGDGEGSIRKDTLVTEELKKLRDIERAAAEKAAKEAKLRELEEKAKREMAAATPPGVDATRSLLITAAFVMVIVLPFTNIASSILLGIFTVAVAVIAGISSKPSRYLNLKLAASIIGILIFQYAAIYQYHVVGAQSGSFWAFELLAVLFLFSTYYSVKAYFGRRQKEL